MRRVGFGAAGLTLAVCGFLAVMAWTGGLVGIDGHKVRLFAWFVEDIAVGYLGRAGGAALFAGLGLASLPLIAWLGGRAQSGPVPERAAPSGVVWMSRVRSNSTGDKPGIRTKFYGYEWDPAQFEMTPLPPDVYANMDRADRGYALQRDELPEAAAVWNEQRFRLLGDIFWVHGFMVVRGRLAEVLSRFDLGEGGLIPFPVYRSDLATPYPGAFFLLNFGCIKNTILPEQCEDARKFVIRKATGMQIWHINDLKPEGEVVLSLRALDGPDLWFEEASHDRVFISNALAEALIAIDMGDVFDLHRCRIA